jgi:branched-chain amino acid transport system substrate-binding protein
MEYATGAPGTEEDVFTLDGCEIQILVRDDQGSAETTATLARELIEVEDVDLLVGTVSSGSTATLQEIALENDVVLIVAPAAANDITGANFNDHTFRTSRENYQDFINLCQYLTTVYDTFVQIAPDYSFGYGGATSARDACTFFGGEFVADDIFAPLDTTDFTAYMEQIYNSGADAWIVTWAGGGFVPMFQAARELGVLDEMGMGASFFDNRTMVAVFSPVADEMVGQTSGILYHYTAPDNPINDWLVEQIKARYGELPDLFDADGMNAAILALEAIKATDGDTSAAALIPALEGLEFAGPKGSIYIRPEDHVAIQDMYIVKLINLDDPEFKIFELVTTTRPEPPCLLPEDLQDRCGELPIGSLTGIEVVEKPEVAPEGPPDLTGETITIYHFGDLSGPYGAITSPLIHGAEDAIAAINAAGGLYGATLEIKFADTAGSIDEAVAAYDRFTGEDDNPLVMITYGSGEVEALAQRFAEDKVVNLTAGLSARGFYVDSGYTFGLGPIYPDQIGAVMNFLKENWDTYKPADAGDEIKLAYISWPTAFGQGALTDESRAYLAELGIEIVTEEVYDLSPTADTTTAILNAQAAGANVIWTNTLAFGPAAILNDLHALGLRDQFVVAGDNWAMDLATYAFLAEPAYGVGLIAPFPYLWWTDVDNPGIQYAQQLFVANERPVAEHNVGYLLLIAGVDLIVDAMELAIDTVGYENLTGEALHDALIALGPYEALDGVLRVDFSGDNRSPHTSQIRMIQGGPDAFNVLQDWAEIPDLRPTE